MKMKNNVLKARKEPLTGQHGKNQSNCALKKSLYVPEKVFLPEQMSGKIF
jgi:hypothetical protein